jgi:hypothetical protein
VLYLKQLSGLLRLLKVPHIILKGWCILKLHFQPLSILKILFLFVLAFGPLICDVFIFKSLVNGA